MNNCDYDDDNNNNDDVSSDNDDGDDEDDGDDGVKILVLYIISYHHPLYQINIHIIYHKIIISSYIIKIIMIIISYHKYM